MSGLGGFLFGNIDEEGRIDNDDFDEELKANLTLFTERTENKKLLGLEVIVEEEAGEDRPKALPKPQQITPLPEAENFEEINELAEDQQKTLPPSQAKSESEFSPSLPVVPKLEEPQVMTSSNLDDAQVVPFDGRQILQFSRLSAPPSLLNATGRSFSRYSVLRKLRPKKRNLHNKQISPVENQVEAFLQRVGSSLTVSSAAAARLKLSLVNLNSASAATANVGSSGAKSARLKELKEAFEAAKSAWKAFEEAHPQHAVHLPDNVQFHPLSLTRWEDEIVWSPEDENVRTPNDTSPGMYVNIAGTPSAPSNQPPGKPVAGPSTTSSASANPPSAGPSLSSILSSLSLSGSGIGGDSATATALLALIRNQHMQRSSSQSSLNSSTSSLRATTPIMTRSPSLASRQAAAAPQPTLKFPKSRAARIRNRSLEDEDWTQAIIWDPREADPAKVQTHLILPLDDPQLVFTAQTAEQLSKKLSRAEKLIAKRLKKLRTPAGASEALYIADYSRPLPDKFNISNDKYYEATAESSGSTAVSTATKAPEVTKMQSSAAASSISAAFLGLSSSVPALQHSVPALKLSSPAFQTCRTKRELRLWHRPRLAYPSGLDIDAWARIKCSVKKTAGGLTTTDTTGPLPVTLHVNQAGGVVRSFKKLSLRDSCRFALLEYSEEFPPLLLNPGMGTYVVLYYRKKSPQDTFVPSSTFATVQVLDFTDPSPFWMFGDVPAGTSRYALCNGLFRSPLFPHPALASDFLCGRRVTVTGGGDDEAAPAGPEFFLRPLDLGQVFCVGQTLPVVEVPGPHSRRHNQLCRNRLQVAAYRLFHKDLTGLPNDPSRRRLKISRLLTAFPQFSEGSIRKWLKDYAESTRAAKDSGVWLLKTDAPQLDEDDLRNLMTPEMVCAYESMLAEQQRISDAELMLFDPLAKDADKNSIALEEAAEDMQSESESVSTAPAAAAAKKRSRPASNLSGPLADVVKTTPWQLTANFLSAVQGRTALQLRGLGDPSGHGEAFSFVKASVSNMILGGKPGATLTPTSNEYRQEVSKIWEAQVAALSTAHPPRTEPVIPDSFTPCVPPGSRLSIQRRLADGEVVTETVEDPLVIAAYLRHRLLASAAAQNDKKLRRGFMAPDALPALSGADLLQNNSRPAASSKKSASSSASASARPAKIPSAASAKNLLIKCGACGQVGHMRTNRICPLFGQPSVPEPAPVEPAPVRVESAGGLKLKLKVVGPAGGSGISNDSTLSSTDSIFPSPDLLPVSHRPKGPPIQPLPPKPRKRQRALTPKQQHSLFLSSLSAEVRGQLVALSSLLVAAVDAALALPTTLAFHKPVSKRLYPLYYKMIAQPIDLSAIRTKAVALMYLKSSDLLDDFTLMARNCDQFNGQGSPLSLVAWDMVERVKSSLDVATVTELDAFLTANISNERQVTAESTDGNEEADDNEDNGQGETTEDIQVSIVTDPEDDPQDTQMDTS